MRLYQLARCSAKANSVATIIHSGGGYEGFLEEPEGIGTTERFTQHGIVGIMLEYRLPKSDVYRSLLYDAQPTRRHNGNPSANRPQKKPDMSSS